MSIVKDWLIENGYEEFARATEFNLKPSDDEKQPYKWKYEAREIFKQLKSKLEDYQEDYGANISLNEEVNGEVFVYSVDVLLSVIHFECAMNFIECEEVPTGEDYLQKCLDLIDKSNDNEGTEKSNKVYSTLLISVHNQLGILWSKRFDFEKALKNLSNAERLYKEAISSGCTSPVSFNEYWKDKINPLPDSERQKFFDNLHTLTLYYIAQVYNNTGKAELSAQYCHETLSRQMKSGQYEAKDWSLNCATLSQYYLTKEKYFVARYCLACSELISNEAVEKFNETDFSEKEEKPLIEEKLFKARADVYRCWAKYGLNLLQTSHECNLDNITALPENFIDEVEFKKLRFGDLDVEEIENQVGFDIAKNYQAAKKIFTFSIKCINFAKNFFKLDGYVSDYVEITQDFSQLYKYLAFFDDDFDNRCKMHKRRIDMLNVILVQLNPQHFLQICRQLTFEIAEAYSEMVALKKRIIEENPEKFSVNTVKKINFLIIQSLKYYNGFIDSYKRDDKLPDKFEDDDVRGILLCYFCMARLNSKYYTNEKEIKRQYLLKEKECYSFIVDYCDKHKDAVKMFDEELSVSREMLALFDAKLEKTLQNM